MTIGVPDMSTTMVPTAGIIQLTLAERQYLDTNVIKPYGEMVQGITKCLEYNGSNYYLELRLMDNGSLKFVNLNPMVNKDLFKTLHSGDYKTIAEFGYAKKLEGN